ncbi:MAG: FtsX-like permease family protein, partial [Acidimicrobiales bacterium]
MTSSGSSRPARRAIVRWALRLLRREWRQHVLVVALLTLTVGGALFGTTVAYNLAPSDEGTSGSANFRFNVTVDDRPRLDEFVADAAAFFGEVELITHRDVPLAGSTEGVEIRSQDPAGRFGAAMLALVDGRFPAAAGEIALTDGSARLLDASIGDAVELGGERATVVGIVENPHKLDDEFALAAPSPTETPDAATILLHADGDYDDSVRQFESPAAPDNWSVEPRGQSEKTVAAIGVLVAATVAMSLVTLVAAAAFVVIAQRRQHQLCLLAAAGATERQVRLVMIAGGAAVGLIAAIAGAILAFAAWVVALPPLETAGGRRLGRFDIPWWTVVAGLTLAVATSLAAAWWPARTIARQPIMAALSGRPQPPRRARRSAAAAFALLAAGITAITFALDPSK